MNIIWNENPLLTQIMLEEHEKKELWYKIKIDDLQELMIDAYLTLDDFKSNDVNAQHAKVAQACRDVNPEYFVPAWNDSLKKGQKSNIDKRVDQALNDYINVLENEPHTGDCTCVSHSCTKCNAERLLEINTIKGLGKHEANLIKLAFTKSRTLFPTRQNQNTIHDVIVDLEQYIPSLTREGSESYYEQWILQHINATTWLKKYRDDHLSQKSMGQYTETYKVVN